MTLFSRLLRQGPGTDSTPKSQGPKTAVQNKAIQPPGKSVAERIADLQTQSAEFVAGIALGDDDNELRCAAIAKLGAGDALYKLAASQGAGTVQRAAQQRVAKLIDDRSLNFDDYRRNTSDIATVLSVRFNKPSLLAMWLCLQSLLAKAHRASCVN
jgi:hypothetical protein